MHSNYLFLILNKNLSLIHFKNLNNLGNFFHFQNKLSKFLVTSRLVN